MKMEYKVVDKLAKGDYIFIHYNGYVFNANNYPYNLRDGIAKRDLFTGESVEFIPGEDTADIMCKTIFEPISINRENNNEYRQRKQNQRAV